MGRVRCLSTSLSSPPTSPSHACGVGPFLSALKGGEEKRVADMQRLSITSPIGPLTIVADNNALVAIEWRDRKAHDESPLLREAAQQLGEYFAGTRQTFELPLASAGEPFEQRVRELMAAIPYGETRRYGELAQ